MQSVGQYEAVRLFIERALFHLPGFAVTNRNAPALASVCHRLDGIPLAIELAAAREALGEAAFAAAWAEGRTMTWEQAVAIAFGEAPP